MYKSLDKVYLENVATILKNVLTEQDANIPGPEQSALPPPKPKKTPVIDASYDEIIYSRYPGDKSDLEKITGIQLPSNSTKLHIVGDLNKKVWSSLFEIAPPKKGKAEGQTKGSGNGELAMYWFLKKSNPGVRDTRYEAAGKADIAVGDVGVEVKAYPMNDLYIKIGKFRTAGESVGKQNNIAINTVLGMGTLMGKIAMPEGKSKGKIADPGNFNFEDFNKSFEKINKLYKAVDDPYLLSNFDIFKQIHENIDLVYGYLGKKESSEELAKNLLWKTLIIKILNKPGPGGFIINCDVAGNMEWFKIPTGLDPENMPSAFKGDDVKAGSGELFVSKRLFR